MNYVTWRNNIFGQNPDRSAFEAELLPETEAISPEETLDHIDCALCDDDIHTRFSPDQIAIGLDLIYDNHFSNIWKSYLLTVSDTRRVIAIHNLNYLYINYFNRYCSERLDDSRMYYICNMFWDNFPIDPSNASQAMKTAALKVMADALQMKNEQCIESAIHGLGHWAMEEPRSKHILQQWLRQPTTQNVRLLEYADEATTGCIQ